MPSIKARGAEFAPRSSRPSLSERAITHALAVRELAAPAVGDDRVAPTWATFVNSFASQDWLLIGYFVAILVALAFGKGPTAAPASIRVSADFGMFLFVLALVRGNVLRWGGAAASLLYRVAIIATLLDTFFQLREILPAVSPWTRRRAHLRVRHEGLRLRAERVLRPLRDAERRPSGSRSSTSSTSSSCRVHVLPMVFWQRDTRVLDRFATGVLLDVPDGAPHLHDRARLRALLVPEGRSTHELDGRHVLALVRETVDAGGAQKDIFPSLHTGVADVLRHLQLPPSQGSCPSSTPGRSYVPGHADHHRHDVPALALPRRHLRRAHPGDDRASSSGQRVADWERAKRERLGLQAAWMPLVLSLEQAGSDGCVRRTRPCRMLGFEIIGTGHYVPGRPVTNDDLSRVMDTSDDWIFQRSGIRQRHFAPEGSGVQRPRARGEQARHRGRAASRRKRSTTSSSRR